MRRLRSRKKALLALTGLVALGLLAAEITARLPSAGQLAAHRELARPSAEGR